MEVARLEELKDLKVSLPDGRKDIASALKDLERYGNDEHILDAIKISLQVYILRVSRLHKK